MAQRPLLWVLPFLALSSHVYAHSNPSAFASAGIAGNSQTTSDEKHFPGRVTLDPRHVAGVVLKVNARIVGMRDLYVGRPVQQGEVLAEFESAELETIQRTYAEIYSKIEYVRAISVTADEKLIEARMNLRWRGLSEDDLGMLESSLKPVRKVAIKAPQDGYLLDILAAEGQVVNPGAQSGLFSLTGTTLFRIADQEAVLVEASVPPAEAASVQPGDLAQLRLSPTTEPLAATVEEVVPYSPPGSLRRTIRLRPLAGATLLGLRDGMRVSVSLGSETQSSEGPAHDH